MKQMNNNSTTASGPFLKFIQQMAINIAYAATSLSIGVRGATLLDLTYVYRSDVETLSMNLVFYSIAKAVGCLVCGEVLQRAPQLGYLWFFVNLLVLATSTTLTPFLPSVELFFAAAAALGFAVGCMHTSAGVLSMGLWNGGPGTHMHILMAFFSTGGVLAPLLAKPFLSNDDEKILTENFLDNNNNTLNSYDYSILFNDSVSFRPLGKVKEEEVTSITILYPLIGGLVLIASVGPFVFGIRDYLSLSEKSNIESIKESSRPTRKGRQTALNKSEGAKQEFNDYEEDVEVICKKDRFRGRSMAMVCLALAFCIVVTAYDFGTSSFLATFAVTTDVIDLTKDDGADLLTIFMGASAIFRVVSMFLSLKLSPAKLAALFFSIIMVANVLLLSTLTMWSKNWLSICFALQAAISPLYGNNWVWLNQYVIINGRTGSFITAIASVGNILSPILIGQMVNSVPMVLIYFELASGCLCCTFYLIGSIIGRPILQSKSSPSAI